MFFQNTKLGSNKLWQYFLVLLGSFFAVILGSIPLLVVMTLQGVDLTDPSATGMLDDPNESLALNLIPFVAAFFAMWGLIKLLHKRSLSSVLTGRPRIDWSRIFFGGVVWLIVMGGAELLLYFMNPENYELIFNWRLFLPLLAIALLVLPIQTSFEELLFRGYLMQGFGSVWHYRWVPLVLTSVLFGALHFMNPEVAAFGLGYMATYYILVGLVLGICTIMDEGTELALGMHAVNNVFGALFLTFDGSVLETPAIFKVSSIDPQMMVIMSFIGSAIFLFVLSKKYQWGSFSKLFTRIED